MNNNEGITNKSFVSLTDKSPPFDKVIFRLSPEMSESGSASYNEISDIRAAAGILIYSGSASRNFSISAKFHSRTTTEADRTQTSINLLKSWRMPVKNLLADGRVNVKDASEYGKVSLSGSLDDYKQKSAQLKSLDEQYKNSTDSVQRNAISENMAKLKDSEDNIDKNSVVFNRNTGVPTVLLLSGYGQFKNIPVVMTKLDITYPTEVDYIQCSSSVYNSPWVPILWEVSLSLTEAREINAQGSGDKSSLDKFSLKDFKEGKLQNW